MGRIFFITGTDTGVGKTVLTALLLHYLRHAGCHALALKPFCSGSRQDVRLLSALQRHELAPAELNPYYFPEPVAPLVAARQQCRTVRLSAVVRHLQRVANRCDCLLVEGAGGLLAPLGRRFTARDLIARLHAQVIIVAPNKLGVLNHTLLTLNALQRLRLKTVAVVLMVQKKSDRSASSNPRLLAQMLFPVPVLSIPFLGPQASTAARVRAVHPKLAPTLRRILA